MSFSNKPGRPKFFSKNLTVPKKSKGGPFRINGGRGFSVQCRKIFENAIFKESHSAEKSKGGPFRINGGRGFTVQCRKFKKMLFSKNLTVPKIQRGTLSDKRGTWLYCSTSKILQNAIFKKSHSAEKSKGDPFGYTGDVALLFNVKNFRKCYFQKISQCRKIHRGPFRTCKNFYYLETVT